MQSRLSIRVPLAMAIATSAVTGAALVMNDASRSVIATSGVGVWFANDDAGSISHVSPTGVDATVALAGMVGDLKVEIVDGVPFVVDGTGRLQAVDTDVLQVTAKPVQLPSSSTELVSGGGRLYAIDSKNQSITELNFDGRALSEPLRLDGIVRSAVVDDRGVLWVAKGDDQVVSIDGNDITETQRVRIEGDELRLAVVQGRVVAVDVKPDAARVTVLTGTERGRTHDVPLAPGDVASPQRVLEGLVLPVLSGDDTLALVDVGSGDVRRTDIGIDDHDLGEPAATASRVYVPDFTSGALLVVDTATGKVLDTLTVTGRSGQFEVVVEGGRVYVNDPNSERAWTIDSSGQVTETKKYDPNAPGGGAVSAPVVPDRPPLPPPPANPAPPKKDDGKKDDGKKDDGKKENNGNNGRPDNNRTTPPAPVVVPPRAPAPSPNPQPQPQPQPQPEPGPQPGPGPQPLSDGAAGGVNATADDRRATVSWSPPSNWRTVTGYTVTVQPGNIRHEAGPDARSWTATGLTNGTAYTFTVTANSAEGPGKTVPSGSVTPAAVAPGAPRSISVAPGDGVVDVSWQSPGGGVDEFRVDVLDGGGAVVATRTTTTTSASLNGLTNGTTYTAVVVAINGPTSTPSPPSSSFVPRGRPAAPAPATAAITALLTVTVSWTPPADTGGSPITGYEVSNNGATPQTVGAGVTSLAFPGLVEGSTYTFTVRAVTAVGTSGPATAPAVTVERAVPSAPANVIAVADDGTATLSWDASAGNGTTVTGYTVTSSAGGTYPATGTSASVTGLSNGTSYTFEVRANGANGTQSGPGGSNAVTPSGTPEAPVITGASSTGRTGIQVSFSQASPSNGTTVNGWTATVNGNPVPVGGSPLSVGGLAAGTTYTVEIRANGANGRTSGAASTTVTTDAPLPVPGAVTGLTLSDSDITWVAASNAAYYIVTGTGGLNQRVDAPTTSLAWFFDYGVRVSVTVTPYNAEGVAGASQSRSVRFYDDCGNPSPVPKPRPQPCP